MKILFISLGCDKNLADSETMLGLLASRGYQIVDTEEDADVIIVNTCCFIHDAMEESIETILQMAEYKKSGSLKALIVTGCMAERYREEITKEIPEVDAVLGTASYGHILDAVDGALAGQSYLEMEPLDTLPLVNTHRMVTTGGIMRISRLRKDAISIVLTALFQSFGGISGVFRWSICSGRQSSLRMTE